MDVNLYRHPNPAVTAALRGDQMRSIVREVTELAHVLYVEEVAKKTGQLARSAHVSTEIGGVDQDRWIGVLTIGGSGVDYALPHEFGRGEHPASIEGGGFGGSHVVQHAVDDLNHVLELLDSGVGRI